MRISWINVLAHLAFLAICVLIMVAPTLLTGCALLTAVPLMDDSRTCEHDTSCQYQRDVSAIIETICGEGEVYSADGIGAVPLVRGGELIPVVKVQGVRCR